MLMTINPTYPETEATSQTHNPQSFQSPKKKKMYNPRKAGAITLVGEKKGVEKSVFSYRLKI